MYINETTQKQLDNFDSFIKLMDDMGMTFRDYEKTDEALRIKSLEGIRTAIITKDYDGIGNAEAFFKHPTTDVWVHIEAETPLYKHKATKVRVLVSEGRQFWGDRNNPYRPLGTAKTLKARIEERANYLTERDNSQSRADKFFALNKPTAEKMIHALTGSTPRVYKNSKGWQLVAISYRDVNVEVGLSTLISEGLKTEVAVTVGFNSSKSYSRVSLEKWVEVVDQLQALGLLAK